MIVDHAHHNGDKALLMSIGTHALFTSKALVGVAFLLASNFYSIERKKKTPEGEQT